MKLYSKKQLSSMLNLSPRQITYWALIGAVKPRIITRGSKTYHRFTDKDVKVLNRLKELTDEGIPVGKAVKRLRGLDNGGLLPAGQFQKRLQEEEERAIRFSHPMTFLIIKAVSQSDSQLLARTISSLKRSYDLLTQLDNGGFLWVFPQSGGEEASSVIERVHKELHDHQVWIGISSSIPRRPGDRHSFVGLAGKNMKIFRQPSGEDQ